MTSKFFLNRARHLRKQSTPQEAELWYYLRAKRFHGFKFYRQYVIEPFIVDFCCPEEMIIIELDGGGHMTDKQMHYDQVRDLWLGKKGYRILRVGNNDWAENREAVLEQIYEFITVGKVAPLPSPPPIFGGRGR